VCGQVIDTICGCFVSAKTEPAVQLQVIKVLLTAVTSPACEVQSGMLSVLLLLFLLLLLLLWWLRLCVGLEGG
jgi:hypothetical protein